MKTFALRLRPGSDLKNELDRFVKENNIRAGNILTCVGSLKKATLRLAGADSIKELDEKLEIVSLVGTLSHDGLHLHISLSDREGNTIGGHVKRGCIVYTTAELLIGENEHLVYSREFDQQTNFKEINISDR